MSAHTSPEPRNSRESLTDAELLQLCRESIADGDIDASTFARHIAAEKARIARTSAWRDPFAAVSM